MLLWINSLLMISLFYTAVLRAFRHDDTGTPLRSISMPSRRDLHCTGRRPPPLHTARHYAQMRMTSSSLATTGGGGHPLENAAWRSKAASSAGGPLLRESRQPLLARQRRFHSARFSLLWLPATFHTVRRAYGESTASGRYSRRVKWRWAISDFSPRYASALAARLLRAARRNLSRLMLLMDSRMRRAPCLDNILYRRNDTGMNICYLTDRREAYY